MFVTLLDDLKVKLNAILSVKVGNCDLHGEPKNELDFPTLFRHDFPDKSVKLQKTNFNLYD